MSNNLGNGIVPKQIIPQGQTRRGINLQVSTLLGAHLVTGSEGDINYPQTISDPVYGVLRGDTIAGGVGDIQQEGMALITVGAAGVTAKGRVMPETGGTGCVVDMAPGGAGNNASLVGIAEGSGVAGDIVQITLAGPGITFQQ